MAGFCLIPQVAQRFLAEVRNGSLTAPKLMAMDSAQRRAAFARVVGEEGAEAVNAAFEAKLLLKNVQQGIGNWVQQMAGLTPEVRRTLLDRVAKMDARVLEPAQMTDFLADLAKQNLGVGVTMPEAAQIAQLAKDVSAAKASDAAQFGPDGKWVNAGKAQRDFENYVGGLKAAIKRPMTIGRAITDAAGFSKSIKAAWDNSAPFRQGWKTIFSHNDVWRKNALQTFTDMSRTFGGHEVMDQIMADIYARPEYRNGTYRKMGLTFGREEAFPTSLAERIPAGVGTAYKATENAFQGFQLRMRADLADKMIGIAKKAGVGINDNTQLESIGKLVNSLTSRGHLGKLEPAADVVNVLMFSGRKLKSDLDFLTAHQAQAGVTPFVRQQALQNLGKTVAGTAAVLMLADAVLPGSVEWDPRSSDFGQIRVGSTRFDVSGGMRQLPILAAKLVAGTKSTSTGKVTPLNSGKFNSPTRGTVLGRFARSKASPLAGMALDHVLGEDFKGDSPTLYSDIANFVLPLPIQAGHELATTPNAVPVPVGLAADMLGIGVNSFNPTKKKVKQPYFPTHLPFAKP